MKLEELLGSELFEKVKAKLDEVNANEPDKLDKANTQVAQLKTVIKVMLLSAISSGVNSAPIFCVI